MATPSEDSAFDCEKFADRVRHSAEENSPKPGPKGRVDSTDITAVGGQFPPRRHSYPPQIDLNEDEEHPRLPRTISQPSPSSLQLSPTRSPRPPLGRSPSTPTPTPTPMPRAHLTSYINDSDIHQLPHRRRSRRAHSRRTYSTGRRSRSPNRDSDHGDDSPSVTTMDDNEAANDVNQGDRNPTPTQLFSPGHTPSQISTATGEDEENPSMIGPGSPHPFSAVHRYNEQHVRDVLSVFEQREQHLHGSD